MKTDDVVARLWRFSDQEGGLWADQRTLLREAATAISDLRRQMADAIEEGIASRLHAAALAAAEAAPHAVSQRDYEAAVRENIDLRNQLAARNKRTLEAWQADVDRLTRERDDWRRKAEE